MEEIVITLVLLGSANPRGRAIVEELARTIGRSRVIPDRRSFYVCMDQRGDAQLTVRTALDAIAADWEEWIAMDRRLS